MKNFTIEELNAFRVAENFKPITKPMSQKLINIQCREFIASNVPMEIKITGGCDETYMGDR